MGRSLFLPLLALALLAAGCVAEVPPRRPKPAPAAGMPQQAQAARSRPTLLSRLTAAAPAVDPQVLGMALRARRCALRHGEVDTGTRLALIDYSLPSTQRRLWVFDLQQAQLLYREHVAHGRNSGGNFARHFSNADGSLQSSLGLFRTAETYAGGNGYSLRMDGLEAGINDHARTRALVMHGAWYVDPALAASQGRLGRSLGCPALRPEVAHAVIDDLKQGQLLFAYYPDPAWLAQSQYLHCDDDAAVHRAAAPDVATHDVTAAERSQSRIHTAAN